jgi:hypothetical protein
VFSCVPRSHVFILTGRPTRDDGKKVVFRYVPAMTADSAVRSVSCASSTRLPRAASSRARDLAVRATELDRRMRRPRPDAHKVVVLVLDGVYPFELGIPHRILGSAGGRYEVLSASVDGRPVRTDADLTVTPGHGPEVLPDADTLVIPPYAIYPASAAAPDPRAVAALSRVRAGTRLVSICTGAFLLAAAGLLDGPPPTGRWPTTFRSCFRRSSSMPAYCSSTTVTC